MMLPNFLIIGAEKSATSWLARCLGEHSDVFVPEAKEIFFFDHNFEKGLAWYGLAFNDWAGQAVVGEATPSYFTHLGIPDRIQQTLGSEVKFIVSLRHPVDRAHSAFWHRKRLGKVPNGADFRTYYHHNRFGLRNTGFYFSHLSRYFEVFPQEKFSIFIYEEMKRDNRQTIRQCFEFLDVNSQFIPASLNDRINRGGDLRLFHGQVIALRRVVVALTNLLSPRLRKSVKDVGRFVFEYFILRRLPKQEYYAGLDQNLRQELLYEFMPDIKQLEDLLKRDLAIWYTS